MTNIIVPVEYLILNICRGYDNDGDDITDFPDNKIK